MARRREYTFHIENGEAVATPVDGGVIQTYRENSPATGVQPQGSSVVVTYANGRVMKYPWPTEGGLIEILADGKTKATPKAASEKSTISEIGTEEQREKPFRWAAAFIASIILVTCWVTIAIKLVPDSLLGFGIFGGLLCSIYMAFNMRKTLPKLAGIVVLAIVAASIVG